jgi:signal peptidase I
MTKKKWLGSLLNFLVPGLGNIYSRNIKKGILTYILFFVVVFSLRFVAYNFGLFLISATLIVGYYLYLVISGYRDVKKDHVYEPVYFDKWYVFILILILHWVLINSIRGRTLDKLTPINFASIPTPAMDPALLVGDILAFKKTKAIDRNDVTIFWFPDNVQTMYVKRCIGLPGDSLRIRNSTVLINGDPLTNTPLKYKFLITTDGSEINSRILDKNQINENDYFKLSSDTYQFFLTEQQAQEFRELPFLKKVELTLATEGHPESMIYPKSENLKWNTDFYGPIYIPKRGDKIQLTGENIDFYLKCIEFENESVERDNSGLKVNGQLVSTYEFKENYFFMMGDNRHNSLDSRYWGLLPQELVIGKAMYLYWGRTSDRISKKVI